MGLARRLRNFAALSGREQLATLEAGLMLVRARLLIALVPLARWRDEIALTPPDGRAPAPLTARQRDAAMLVTRAIDRAARHVPARFVCLPQALAARWMLARRQVPTELFFGTRHAAESDREFHAWLKAGKMMVTGACDERDYVVFGSQRRS